MGRTDFDDTDRDRKLERDAARERGAHRRQRNGYAYLRNPRLADIAAGLHDESVEAAGVLQPPVKVPPVVPPEKEWSPYQRASDDDKARVAIEAMFAAEREIESAA